jgi:2-amino-4-hydroxy-6-hydroxymethyldihydropteridine diphosphokinase
VARVAVAIALGSNLGDRRGHLDWAVAQLRTLLQDVRVSPIIETDPVDVPDAQPPYLNAALTGTTDLSPQDLHHALQVLEAGRGRTRPGFRSARTLDLDLILYGDRIIDTPLLVVPHPRFRERRFVLEPLSALAPEMIDPVSQETVRGLLLVSGRSGDRGGRAI